MTDRLADLTEALLAAATRAGADAADALAVDRTTLSIDVRGGALEHAERSEGVEIGLRVLLGQRQVCVSASDTRPETIRQMAERAVAMARETPEDPHVGLADPDQLARDRDVAALELADPAAEPAPEELEAAAREAEASALAVAGVAQVSEASAGYSRQSAFMSATNGFSGGLVRTGSHISCVAISGEGVGMERDWNDERRIFRADLPAPGEVGRIAGKRAAALAHPRRAPTGAHPVIYDERVAGSLIGHLVAATNGTAIARGASWARDLLGERILPGGMTLVEDPHRPRASGSRPFDSEGLPTARRAIVEDGVLTGWTLDLATARKLGLASTANAARGTSSAPSPSVGNLDLTQGDEDLETLMRQMGTGLLVTSLIGSTINPNNGDYSRGASGFWVEGGAIAHPVNEITLAGNLRDMLPTLRPANDARAHAARRIPSLLVEGLTIAGA